MKNTSHNYFYTAISFGNLYKAGLRCFKNVRWKDSVVGYENNVLFNTLKLRKRLLGKHYKLDRYQIFKIYIPKERIICATRLADRQVQRALCDNGLYEDFTEHFIRDNVACQKGKGTDDALDRLKIHMRKFYNKYNNTGYVLKCDIRHFFQSTKHDVAKRAVAKCVSDLNAREIVYKVIDSFDEETGIGLGSQVGQLIELAVLNDLDHFIKEKLHIKWYIRYADDFILLHPDKNYLNYCKQQISRKLNEIGLELNTKKTMIFPIKQGVTFLQWKFIYSDSGKVLMLMDKAKVRAEKRRLIKLLEFEAEGKRPEGTAWNSLQCWLANAKRGNTYQIQQEMINFYNEEKLKNDERRRIASKEIRWVCEVSSEQNLCGHTVQYHDGQSGRPECCKQ